MFMIKKLRRSEEKPSPYLHRHFIYNFDLYFVEMSLNMSSRINYGMIISYFSINYIILYLQCPDFMENGRLPHFERSVT